MVYPEQSKPGYCPALRTRVYSNRVIDRLKDGVRVIETLAQRGEEMLP